jgi:hypothetical protein
MIPNKFGDFKKQFIFASNKIGKNEFSISE